MRLLILSSIAPDFRHFRAGQTVLAVLLESLAKMGIETGVAIAGHEANTDPEQRTLLEKAGVIVLEGNAFALHRIELLPSLKRKVKYIQALFSSSLEADYPKFAHPEQAADAITAFRPDAVLLFWDTWFEHLLPRLAKRSIPCLGYLARPPQAAGKARLPGFKNPFRRAFVAAHLHRAEQRHIKRMRLLKEAGNICALDATWYNAKGVKSHYLPNTWPDQYGEAWQECRGAAEKKREILHILGNIGGLNATGNLFGIRYLGERVMPLLSARMPGQWIVNICGRFELPAELKSILSSPHIALRGFVPDIDEEMAGNPIFLLLNNAGPYTGGYTRVIYAFASGACLIAHRKLADSMPELVHQENCLLGQTPEEIADLLVLAAQDASLRARLGTAGRMTYEKKYAPSHVAQKLVAMVRQTVKTA